MDIEQYLKMRMSEHKKDLIHAKEEVHPEMFNGIVHAFFLIELWMSRYHADNYGYAKNENHG